MPVSYVSATHDIPASGCLKSFTVILSDDAQFPHYHQLEITEKVSFNIASEASYVYISIKNAQNCPF